MGVVARFGRARGECSLELSKNAKFHHNFLEALGV